MISKEVLESVHNVEAYIKELEAENKALKGSVEAAEAFRPLWAEGHSSDSVAAQVMAGKVVNLEATIAEQDRVIEAAQDVVLLTHEYSVDGHSEWEKSVEALAALIKEKQE